ncbi:MAG: DedA family protein [Spirochaetae bacterium HGW-Spirochaetae-1]|jgi:membrane protein DedA with SNARE-associated domain|nr:MAG: DedA family protein [Spirochaetae bacterium HGW-Spirochaetae-1]
MELLATILTNAAPYVHFISFALLVLAGFSFPISEDLVFIISASIAATIIPENTYYIFAGCFLGAYSSDIVAYAIGRYAGGRILASSRLYKIKFFNKNFSKERLGKLEMYFDKYGSKTLFFGRFVPFGVRNMLFMTAGLIKMKFKKFLLIDFIALVCTSSILFYLGYSFGENYRIIFPYLNRYKILIFILFIFIAILFNRKRIFYFWNKLFKKTFYSQL